jgi:hypothetical protein
MQSSREAPLENARHRPKRIGRRTARVLDALHALCFSCSGFSLLPSVLVYDDLTAIDRHQHEITRNIKGTT